MEALKLKVCHYLNCESHIYLDVLPKTNEESEHNFGRYVELLRLIHMYPGCRMRRVSGL